MQKKILFVLFFLASLCSTYSYAQNKQTEIDSLKADLTKDSAHIYRFRKVLPLIAIDTRNSYINKTPVNIYGFQIGVTLFEKHNVGLGFYSIIGSTKHTKTVGDKNEVTNRNLNLSYMTAFYYYPLLDRKYIEFGFPLEIGGGFYKLNVTDQNNNSYSGYPKPNTGMLVLGASVSLTLKPIRWLGLNGMCGFRKVSSNNPNLNLNGFFYSYGVTLYVHQIIMDYKFYKKKKRYKESVKQLLD